MDYEKANANTKKRGFYHFHTSLQQFQCITNATRYEELLKDRKLGINTSKLNFSNIWKFSSIYFRINFFAYFFIAVFYLT